MAWNAFLAPWGIPVCHCLSKLHFPVSHLGRLFWLCSAEPGCVLVCVCMCVFCLTSLCSLLNIHSAPPKEWVQRFFGKCLDRVAARGWQHSLSMEDSLSVWPVGVRTGTSREHSKNDGQDSVEPVSTTELYTLELTLRMSKTLAVSRYLSHPSTAVERHQARATLIKETI